MISLKVRRLPVEIGELRVVLNRADAEKVSISPHDRVRIVKPDGSQVVALASVSSSEDVSPPGQVGVFADVVKKLPLDEGEVVSVEVVPTPQSAGLVRKKVLEGKLTPQEVSLLIKDIYEGVLSDVELAAFVTALQLHGADMDEVEALTRSMAEVGTMLDFGDTLTVDKHSVGGVPGNSKDALLIVPIVAAAGLVIPKTSTRAIMSPAGTVDTMEVLAPVDLKPEEIVELSKKVGGVIAWAASANLSPVDGILIEKVEYPLSLDPESLIYASIMSKKLAAGVKRMVLDIPVGPEAKVESLKDARRMGRNFVELGERLNILTQVAISYGGQPIGRYVGPALEAKEALEILMSKGKGSRSIIEKSLTLAGILLEMGGAAPVGYGERMAREILESGRAFEKMREIIEAQGGDPDVKPEDLPIGEHKAALMAKMSGYVVAVSNRAIVKIARAAGAPRDKGAGVRIYAKRGDRVEAGDTVIEIFAESESKLQAAVEVAKSMEPIRVEGMVLEVFRDRTIGKEIVE